MQIKELKCYANIPYKWKKVNEIWTFSIATEETALAFWKKMKLSQTSTNFHKFPNSFQTSLKIPWPWKNYPSPDYSLKYRIRPNYRTARLGFSKLLGTLSCCKIYY